jgi:hypothetical protein
MNDDQLINHLQEQIKPWVNKLPQPTFSNNIIRYKAGILKPSTLKMFFERLGYIKTQEGWVKG